MRMHVGDVVAVLGVMVTAPGVAGVWCCTTIAGHGLHEVLVAVVAIGVVLTIAGLVARFETQRRAWEAQTEAVLQARRQAQRLVLAQTTWEATSTMTDAPTLR
jgi:Tfp pilus assembly protein PilV